MKFVNKISQKFVQQQKQQKQKTASHKKRVNRNNNNNVFNKQANAFVVVAIESNLLFYRFQRKEAANTYTKQQQQKASVQL